MKIFYLILSLYVILLSTFPCCLDEVFGNEACNDEIKSGQTDSNQLKHECENCCDTAVCSPFLTCGSCAGFVSNIQFVSVQPYLVFVKKQNIPYQLSRINRVNPEFWQPPKLMTFGVL